MNKCIHITNDSKCSSKSNEKYGGYCKKHRKEFLLKDNIIHIDHFSSDCRDYSLPELKDFYNRFLKGSEKTSKFKKQDYFKRVDDYYSRYKKLSTNKNVTTLQAILRRNLVTNKIKLRGIGFLDRNICNNDEDFYTYESKHDIEDKYFFSYKDGNNNHWCFDIRSFKKLIDLNYDNPYTTEPISGHVKTKVNNLIKYLHNRNIEVVIDNTIVASRETLVKQKFVDIFSQIEYSGYSCNIDWILRLNNIRLKKLYRELEDIWNYRANLQQHIKCNIAPPSGRLFVMPVQDYLQCDVKIELLEIIANELSKILHARTPSDMNLGFMYFIMGLSMVSRECLEIHPWVQYAF